MSFEKYLIQDSYTGTLFDQEGSLEKAKKKARLIVKSGRSQSVSIVLLGTGQTLYTYPKLR